MVLLCLLTACNDQAQSKATIKVMNKNDMRTCIENGGSVAIIRVKQVEIELKGTRSEGVRIHAAVERALAGEAKGQLEICRYTSKSDPVLAQGNRYIVEADRDQRLAPAFRLRDFIELQPDTEKETIAACESLLKEAK
jgi:hypothetical protein